MYKLNPSNNSFFISEQIRDELAKVISPFDIDFIFNQIRYSIFFTIFFFPEFFSQNFKQSNFFNTSNLKCQEQ